MRFGTAVVLDTMSKSINFGFRWSRLMGTGSSIPTSGSSCHLRVKLITYFYENYVDNTILQYIA